MSVFFRRRGKAIELAPDPLPIYVAGDTALRNGATMGSYTTWTGQYGTTNAWGYQSNHFYISSAWNAAGTAIARGYVNIKIPTNGYSKLVVTAKQSSSGNAWLGYYTADTLSSTYTEKVSLTSTSTVYTFDVSTLDVVYLKTENYRNGIYIYDIHLE